MRRFIAIALSVLMLLTATLPAIAETNLEIEIFHNQSDVASSTVTYGVNEAYTVYIPARIDMAEVGVTEATVSVEEVYLPRAKALAINLSSQAYASDSWQLTLSENSSVTLSYSIKNGGTEVANNGEILTCPGGTDAAQTTLSLEATGSPGLSGSYLDTLTFTVSINEN